MTLKQMDSSAKDCTENCPLMTLKLVDSSAKDRTENCPLMTLKRMGRKLRIER
jgi:hypothetical protein